MGSAALIIVLSAFNGLEQLVRGFYADFDPDLKVLPLEGKFFEEQAIKQNIAELELFSSASAVLEEKALFNFVRTFLRELDLLALDLNKHIEQLHLYSQDNF